MWLWAVLNVYAMLHVCIEINEMHWLRGDKYKLTMQCQLIEAKSISVGLSLLMWRAYQISTSYNGNQCQNKCL